MDLNWHKLANTSGDHGHFREGHTLTYIKHLDSLLLYGGVSNPRLNAVYLYSIKNNAWAMQPTQGRKPSHRSHHSALYDEHLQLYMVYAGEAEKGRSLDDFYVLVMKNWTWKKLFLMQFPPARHLHTMTDMRNQERSRVIFGGISLPSGQLLNDVWIFKGLSSLQSSGQVHEMQGCSCDIQFTKGDVPAARKGHQAEVHGKCLYVFGGEAKDKNTHFTVSCLSLETFSWRRLEIKGKSLAQRIYFSTVSYGADVLIYGGLEPQSGKVCSDMLKFNVVSAKLEEVKSKNCPLGRYGHSMAITSNSQIDILRVFMVGGMEQTFRPFDMYQLTDGGEEQQHSKANISRMGNLKDYSEQIESLQIKIIKEKQEKLKLERHLKQKHQQSVQAQKPSRFNIPVQQLMTMIKSEQFLSQEILKKNSLLESLLRKIQEYVYSLNQNYLSYGQQEDIERTKQSHIAVCTRLKEAYQLVERHYKKNLTLISNSRNQVISYNNEFQGLMETEIDQES